MDNFDKAFTEYVLSLEFDDTPRCEDPRCENGTIVGDEYVTREGDVDNYTWDCSTCNPAVLENDEF